MAKGGAGDMVECRVEPLDYLLQTGLRELAYECWKLIEKDIQKKFSPHWPGYQEEEENGNLRFISLRDNNNLIGYASVRFGEDPHNAGMKAVTLVDIFITEGKRGNAIKFFRYIENLVYSLGAYRIIASERLNINRDVGSFYKFMGFYPKEVLWTKILGKDGTA